MPISANAKFRKQQIEQQVGMKRQKTTLRNTVDSKENNSSCGRRMGLLVPPLKRINMNLLEPHQMTSPQMKTCGSLSAHTRSAEMKDERQM